MSSHLELWRGLLHIQPEPDPPSADHNIHAMSAESQLPGLRCSSAPSSRHPQIARHGRSTKGNAKLYDRVITAYKYN